MLDYIVMQTRKINREKGYPATYYHTDTIVHINVDAVYSALPSFRFLVFRN